ncbi:hypothetical protein BZG36_01776 [Bifiguratus adelaidae]|uniref:Ribosomal eL28/Mak16 domain-containing protein n=1 Tax=Bifiguratus adelaidae TaxID=1938954 RepID=A0A261Y301_9FUNG|nr:hypothetical protein BZG36_01776 [Bifiguratus adelaidae]
MSSDLIWALVKDNNSFLVKRSGVQFSTEPGNLKNLNTYKYSGLANHKVVHVTAAESGRGVEVHTRNTKVGAHKPAKSTTRVTISKGPRHAAKALNNVVSRNGYRPDLREAALGRLSRVRASQKAVKPHTKKTKGPRAAKRA